MVKAGGMEDYTYLWHDVRPHPNFGTVEIRVMDSQTHIEHSLGLAALVQALVRELALHFESGQALSRYPFEMLDENKWLAARHGLDGELVDLPHETRVSTRALARRLIDRMREHAQDLGSEADLQASLKLLFPRYKQRIVVACFSSNVARIESIALAAAASGRQVAVVGRSLWRIRNSSSENWRAVSVTSVAPRQTRWAAGSSRRSPASSTLGVTRRPRRMSARIRATSTTYEKGLDR